MLSSFSPPVLCLTDDDDDSITELNVPYTSSYASVANNNLPRKKRRLPETDTRISSSIINWSKRQRNDPYSRESNHYNAVLDKPDTIRFNSDAYHYTDPESHSFHAFDWTTETPILPKNYSNPIQTAPRISLIPPSSTVMNVVKHHLDHSDPMPIIPLPHQDDRYAQHSHTQPMNFPPSRSPSIPISLPLPTPTSSLVRSHTQRHHSTKSPRISTYTHSTPPAPTTPLSVHQPIKPIFSSTPPYPSPSPTLIANSMPNSEILRQPLNGSSVLTAFFDSKCYRCNVCKFMAVTSSKLLQHLFTHIFFCHHCSFYSFSQHNLYQHIFEKHPTYAKNDNIDPKLLELLYITRCPDGTFALCMDSSTSTPASTSFPIPPKEKSPIPSTHTVIKPKPIKAKPIKEKMQAKPPKEKRPVKQTIIPSVKSDPQLSKPSSTIARQDSKEKQANTYVLMKHRRCFLTRNPACLHSATLEYNICREHTIRHMCRTPATIKRRKFPSIPQRAHLIDEAAICLKTMVNQLVDIEENNTSPDLICPLPNEILQSIFPTDDLRTMTNLLKLTNKHEKRSEQDQRNRSESSVRAGTQHVFILASNGLHKNEQSIFSSLYASTKILDSTFTQTKLNKLSISKDNTQRFLKGSLQNHLQLSSESTIPQSLQRTNSQSPNTRRALTTDPIISSNGRLSPSSNVIVID